jgi:trk system potassium uptake protein TrkH
MNRITPPQLLIMSFICAILLGTFLLSLPIASQGPESLPLVDSLFTATSAVCVTGLIVVDTGSYFTPFGRWVIFALFQAGGLGIMTFSTLFAVMLGRKLGFRQAEVITSTLDKRNIVGFKKLLLYIISITFAAEALGALGLFARWRAITDWTVLQTAERAVFHSVSAFCNAGFSLFRTSMSEFSGDLYINMFMMLLIFFGGIGFIVVLEMLTYFFRKSPRRRMSFQAKIVLTVSLALILIGAVFIFLSEKGGLFRHMSGGEQVLASLFQSVTARTAGFNTVRIGQMAVPSLIVLIFLMFVGASPGSTGGGIKTTTFTVLGAMVSSILRNKKRTMIYNRSIPRKVIRESLVIFFLAGVWILAFTFLVSFFSSRGAPGNDFFIKALFEVISAFGTVGLSTGITPLLNDISKICIILTMFVGRLGPLTIALAIAYKEKKDNLVYPEETLMVG